MAPWLQTLGNYPVATAGLLMAPRGIGNLFTIVLCGRLVMRVDPRYLVGAGIVIQCWSFWTMTGWTPDVSVHELVTTIVIQGAGLGLVFTPLQVLAFATLPPHLRTEGAALFSLGRNIGAAIGVSVTTSLIAHNAQALHEVIGAIGQSVQSRAANDRRGECLDEPGAPGTARRCSTRWSITRRRSSPTSTTTC